MRIIIFLGYSGSGKTTAIELLTRALTKGGKKVGTVKHIHDKRFTMDVPGKDTWRYARAGASQIVAVAPRELSIIRKQDTSAISLDAIMEDFEDRGFDYVMVEGLYRRMSGRRDVIRVLCARNGKEAGNLLKKHREGVTFITGRIAQRSPGDKPATRPSIGIAPIIRLPRDMAKGLGLIAGRQLHAQNRETSNRDAR